jgi:ABC-2 type transport system permease protein
MDLQAIHPRSSLFTSLATVFSLTLRQLGRGRRLLVLAAIFALPAVLAIIARSAEPPAPTADLEFVLLLNFLPVCLIPLTCLLYASGLIQDEIEDQTLTYFLIRPIPRSLLYLTRLVATYLMVIALGTVFVLATSICVWWGSEELFTTAPRHAAGLLLVLLPVTFVYTALFAVVSLYVRRLLAFGIGYIVIFEFFLANMDFVLRKLTVFFHFRVLILNWINNSEFESRWGILLSAETTPSLAESLITLLVAGFLLALIGAVRFRSAEYKVKTPGES